MLLRLLAPCRRAASHGLAARSLIAAGSSNRFCSSAISTAVELKQLPALEGHIDTSASSNTAPSAVVEQVELVETTSSSSASESSPSSSVGPSAASSAFKHSTLLEPPTARLSMAPPDLVDNLEDGGPKDLDAALGDRSTVSVDKPSPRRARLVYAADAQMGYREIVYKARQIASRHFDLETMRLLYAHAKRHGGAAFLSIDVEGRLAPRVPHVTEYGWSSLEFVVDPKTGEVEERRDSQHARASSSPSSSRLLSEGLPY